MADERFPVDYRLLENFMKDAFVAAGVPADDAAVCANVLISADLRGIDSHGIGRLKPFYLDRIKDGVQNAVTKVDFVRRGPTTAVVDGNAGMAMVVGKRSMEYAIECAKKYGMGAVAVRNSSHYGMAGYYAQLAADAGMVGFACTNARPSIAPTFGTENMLGTNPMAFSMPTDEEFNFNFDSATSVAQRGKIEYYGRAGKAIPPGWVIDIEGKTRTDTLEILEDLSRGRAALAPLGGLGEEGSGYKGYGFATVVELLCAALQQGLFLKALSGIAPDGSKKAPGIGHFFMAINIESFTDLADFRKTAGDIMRELRASRKAPGCEHIFTAGEKEYRKMVERKINGVPISPTLQKTLCGIRDDYGLTSYKFPFEK